MPPSFISLYVHAAMSKGKIYMPPSSPPSFSLGTGHLNTERGGGRDIFLNDIGVLEFIFLKKGGGGVQYFFVPTFS